MKQQELNKQRNYEVSPRTAFERDRSFRDDLEFSENDYKMSPTKQSERDACDINKMMDTFQQTGYFPPDNGGMMYGDFSTMETFDEVLRIVSEAQSQFHSMPAAVRAAFDNDPAKFLGAIESAERDPKVASELVKLGILELRPETAAQKLDKIVENTKPQPPKKKSKDESAAD